MLSRVKDAEVRAQLELDDKWDQLLKLDTEERAFGEFEWLLSHASIREYILVRAFVPVETPWRDDIAFMADLDDDIPF